MTTFRFDHGLSRFAITLSLLLTIGLLPGCGGDEEDSGSEAASTPAQTGSGGGGATAPADVVDPATPDGSQGSGSGSASANLGRPPDIEPSADPSGSAWRVGEVTVTLNVNRTLGSGHEEGGRWRQVRPGYLELIGASGEKFIDLTLSTDGQTGQAFWADGTMQIAHRIQ